MTLYIPLKNEMLPSQLVPGPVLNYKFSIGADSDADVQISSTGVKTLVMVEPGILVHSIRVNHTVAWTSSVVITIGDSDSAAGFWTDTDLNPASSDTADVYASQATTEAYFAGRHYSVEQPIQAAVSGTTPLAGHTNLVVTYAYVG
jgi:hypothetical protein